MSAPVVAAAAADAVPQGELPGPVGERNTYGERPRGTILCVARDAAERAPSMRRRRRRAIASPTIQRRRTSCRPFAGREEDLWRSTGAGGAGRADRAVYVAPYPVEFLGAEVSLSVNTAAAGGNASLMTIG